MPIDLILLKSITGMKTVPESRGCPSGIIRNVCLIACTKSDLSKDQSVNTDSSGTSEETLVQETTTEQDLNEQRPYSEDMDWMDYVISCAANVDMDEITDEVYQSVECIYINHVRRTHSDTFEYQMGVYFDDRDRPYRITEGMNGFRFPDVISIRNPEKYTGLQAFIFTNQLSDDLSEFHVVDWNSICQLTSLKRLV